MKNPDALKFSTAIPPASTQPGTPLPTPTVCPQQYAFLCVVDLEASINSSSFTHEVTEFPLLLLSTASPSLPLISEFHTFIRPTRNKSASDHKRSPQQVLDSFPNFPEARTDLLAFLNLHGVTSSNALAITCGDWDFRSMLPAEQAFHGIPPLPLFENWCNIKHAFTSFTGKKADSMVRMLNVTGQELVGTHHSGIDDARNIANIARWLAQRGCVFKITSDGSVDESEEAVQHQQNLRREKEQVKKVAEAARMARLEAGAMPPQEMFKTEEFAEWDDDGVPTRLADGTPMSKSAVNKRRKMWKAQKVLHEKYLAWRES